MIKLNAKAKTKTMTKLHAKSKTVTLDPSEIRLVDIDPLCRVYRIMNFMRQVKLDGEWVSTETRVYKEDHKTLSSYKREIISRLNWAIKAEADVTFSR